MLYLVISKSIAEFGKQWSMRNFWWSAENSEHYLNFLCFNNNCALLVIKVIIIIKFRDEIKQIFFFGNTGTTKSVDLAAMLLLTNKIDENFN